MERRQRVRKTGATAVAPVMSKLTLSKGKRLGATFALAAAGALATAALFSFFV
jgi:hypothetical protein